MKPILRRPILTLALAQAMGALIALTDTLPIFWTAGVAGIAAIACIIHGRRLMQGRILSVAFCMFAASVLFTHGRVSGPPGDPLSRELARSGPTRWELIGAVEDTGLFLPGQDYARLTLRAEKASPKGDVLRPLNGRMLVRWTQPGLVPMPGDRVFVNGEAKAAIGQVNPGAEGMEDYYRRLGIHSAVLARGPDAVVIQRQGAWWNPMRGAAQLRRALAIRLSGALPDDVTSFVLAVWLGDRSDMSNSEFQDYVITGTAHVLSVSGLHVGLLAVTLGALLSSFIRRENVAALIVLAAIALFTLMTGLRAATMRSAFMIASCLSADLVRRERDAPTALGAASIILLTMNPRLLFDAGFALSFLSIGSLMCYTEPITRRLGWVPRQMRQGCAATFAAQLLPLPMALRCFHVLPLFSPLWNLIIVPLLTIILWLCLVMSFTAWVWPGLTGVFGCALAPLVRLVRIFAGWGGELPGGAIYLPTPGPAAMTLYWAAIISPFLWPRAARKSIRWGATAVLLLLCVLLWRPLHQTPETVFLDVGHGDAIWLAGERGRVLVDCGDNRGENDMGARVVAPFLWARGVTRLDLLCVSHPDRDHIGGAAFILDHFKVGAVAMGAIPSGRESEAEFLALCARRGVRVHRLAAGDNLMVGDIELEVLGPPKEPIPILDVNDAALVLRAQWMGHSILLPGDVEEAGERLLTAYDCRAEILKSPHHGSKTSSSPAFLKAVRPSCIIVSSGGSSGREGVDPEVLARYVSLRIPILRTDLLGGVSLHENEDGLVITSARAERGYPTY